MKKVVGVTLGILTAMGGFMDIGDIVTNAVVGARYRMALAWVVVVGIIGICTFAEMAGRVATISQRPVFDLVRERLGPRMALGNLVASFFINFLTLTAELAGVAIALQLVTDVNHLLWIPLVALLVWVVIWRVKFEAMEQIFGILGLTLIVMAVALWQLHPDWGQMLHGATHPSVPHGEGRPTYLYYAIALFGAAMTPYEVFFFSSGAVEEQWSEADLVLNKSNVFIGFPLGGFLSLALMGLAATVLAPQQIEVDHLSQAALPMAVAMGKVGLALVIVGFFAATFGAALETAMSSSYTVSQYLGWQWGKLVKPREAARFHVVIVLTLIASVFIGLTNVDPVKVAEFSVVLSAAALPLTYFPILVVANDPDYMGEHVNKRLSNTLGSVYLVIIVIMSLATLPLMIVTKAGS
jgi:Mn2+/Fe2+ NRAMP family transporter